MKFIFSTDHHNSSINISCRKDFYPDTIYEKQRFIIQKGEELGIDALLIGGDFFHNRRVSQEYVNRLNLLYRAASFVVGCDIGNHDCLLGDPAQVMKCPLGGLLTSGVFIPEPGKWVYETEDSIVVFLPFMIDLPEYMELPKNDKTRILVAHAFYPGIYEAENLPDFYFKNFDYVLLGHDHDAYPLQRNQRSIVVRPGGLARGTRDKSNWRRKVRVFYVDTQYPETATFIEVPHKSAEEIFSKERILLEDRVKQSKVFDVLAKSVEATSDVDILALVDGFKLEPLVKERVVYWLREAALI